MHSTSVPLFKKKKNHKNNGMVFNFPQVILPRATGWEVDAGKLSAALGEMEETLTNIEKIFLKDKPYLCGDEISIADLLGVCEVSTFELYPTLKMDMTSSMSNCPKFHPDSSTGCL